MAKTLKETEITDADSAFEMIELSCEGVESLARAFKMIDQVCKELTSEILEHSEEKTTSQIIH